MTMFFIDSATASAGTAIEAVIPASGSGIPIVRDLKYNCAGTAHTLTVLRPVGHTSTVAASVSGTAILYLTSVNFGRDTTNASETLAANDYLVWTDRFGGFHHDTVASISDTDVTMNNNLTQDVAAGSLVWGCYELARSTHLTITLPASTTTEISGIMAGFSATTGIRTSRSGAGDPLILSINNITAAGTLLFAAGDYTPGDNLLTT